MTTTAAPQSLTFEQHNGDSIALIEVKYRFPMKYVGDLLNRKLPDFRVLFPEYADKVIYSAVAGMSFDNENYK
ncbi:MAG: hypothetical protein LBN39_09055 [Planctomycetaceae bacterium]|jgi:hypothetical protein|nr:hypothetical protein [Planctomycetaceae bacterium]